MAQNIESETRGFHGCICSKLEKLTITGADGQSWRSISVSINFGDYKKIFEIKKEDFANTAEGPPRTPTGSKDAAKLVTELGKRTLKVCLERLPSPIEFGGKSQKKENKVINKCPTCSKQFAHKYSLTQHQKRVHFNMKSRAGWKYRCNICHKKFLHLSMLNSHKIVHSKVKAFKCNECPSCFKRQGDFVKHSKIHEEDSLFSCKFCPKVLASFYSLDRHIRTHTGEKPFMCPNCHKWYRHNSMLKQHVKTAHTKRVHFG